MPAIICCEKIGSESKCFWVRQLRRLFPEFSNEYFQKLKYFLKTQGKNSFFRQVHYPALPKLGRKEKPDLETKPKVSGKISKKFEKKIGLI